uniref:SFRICE_026045 n=1 Tax=Spodoptera frugiperda TaxID=7108 RepID=A0A2H1VDF7_SPOFR
MEYKALEDHLKQSPPPMDIRNTTGVKSALPGHEVIAKIGKGEHDKERTIFTNTSRNLYGAVYKVSSTVKSCVFIHISHVHSFVFYSLKQAACGDVVERATENKGRAQWPTFNYDKLANQEGLFSSSAAKVKVNLQRAHT